MLRKGRIGQNGFFKLFSETEKTTKTLFFQKLNRKLYGHSYYFF